jgi:hypothetical protein
MPAPKDPEKLAAFREKMRQIALERGYGKWMAGRPPHPGVLEYARSRKGKTYEEIYGIERSEEERESRKIGNKVAKAGKRPPHLLKLQEEIAQKRKGKTYAEIYGDQAQAETVKRKETHRKKWEGKPKKLTSDLSITEIPVIKTGAKLCLKETTIPVSAVISEEARCKHIICAPGPSIQICAMTLPMGRLCV